MEEMTILELQEKMNTGEMTALGLLDTYLARIEQLDKQGPAINAVIELNPDASAIAENSRQGTPGRQAARPIAWNSDFDQR